MNTKSAKESIIEGYGSLAKSTRKGLFSQLFSCCDSAEHAAKVGEAVGYSKEELTAVPSNSNLGVGCGNPSALADIRIGETVVDLGSGAGFDAFLVASIVQQDGRVIGVDLSDDMLDLARKNAKKGAYSHVEFVKGDIEDLPLPDELADHIISNCVINLSQQKHKVFQEAYRVLKVGGKLSISDIVLKKDLPVEIKDSLAGHIACISGAELLDTYVAYIRDAGFSEIVIQSTSAFPLELMLADPQIARIAQSLRVKYDSDELVGLASRVASVSITARK